MTETEHPIAPETDDDGAAPGETAAPPLVDTPLTTPDTTPATAAATTAATAAATTAATEPETPAIPAPEGDPVALLAAASPTRTRRAPRFGSFIAVAIVLAALIAGILTFVRDQFLPLVELQGRVLSGGGMFLVLFIGLAPFLTLAAVGLAVWLDRRSVRRMERTAGTR